jgi:hypothetical protein
MELFVLYNVTALYCHYCVDGANAMLSIPIIVVCRNKIQFVMKICWNERGGEIPRTVKNQ